MKKVRITVSKGSTGKSFKIFNSPESIYVWLHDPELQKSEELDVSIGNVIHLKKGEVMEAEWCGCEYIYENESLIFRADYIRLGKLMKNSTLFSANKNVIGIQDGWILNDTIQFKNYSDEKTRTTRLSLKSKHRFNLDELFASREAYEEDEEEIEKSNEDLPLN